MQYIRKSRVYPPNMLNWEVEPCSPFEILEAVNNRAQILLWPTSEALGDFFLRMGWNPDSFLNYTNEMPDDIEPEDIFYFIFCPNPETFQFWKGHYKGED